MIFVLMPSARDREQRPAVGAYDAITQQVFQVPPGHPVRMQHSRIMYGWPEEGLESETPEVEMSEVEMSEVDTTEDRARVCSEAEAALEPAPALRLDLERLPPDTDVPSTFLCPISLALMQDPVVAADGHSYERSYITRWLASKSMSPKNNTPLASDLLFCNYNLRAAIAQWFEQAAGPAPGALTEPDTPHAEIAELPVCAPGVPRAGVGAAALGTPRADTAELPARAPTACEGDAVASADSGRVPVAV